MIKSLLKMHYSLKLPAAIVITITLLLAGFQGVAQQITVSGVVKDAEGPLPGVSILEKGTSQGTATDSDGKFTLAVTSESSVLIFSFIGYKTQEVAVNGRTVVDIVMEQDVTALSEVVVTALGVQKEVKSLGYSVQSVKGESVTKGARTQHHQFTHGESGGAAGAKSNGPLHQSCYQTPRSCTVNCHRRCTKR